MRQSYGGLKWSATVILLVANGVVFLLQQFISPRFLEDYLCLSLRGLAHGYVWQLISFQFLHGGWMHLLFNSLGLFFFGRPVEHVLGRSRFVQLYLSAGVLGGLLQLALAIVFPTVFNPDSGVVGASAGVSGLVAAFAMIHWYERFTLLFYFFPIVMRGRTLFWISIGMAVLGVVSAWFPSGNSPRGGSDVAHAAHLGGLLAGFAWIRWGLGSRTLSWRWKPFRGRQRKRELVKAATMRIPRWKSSTDSPAELPEEEFISREVDPILDKISEHGIQSLTERERKILEAARAKMAKR
jgi:membrane associated rhomboid family serine protease